MKSIQDKYKWPDTKPDYDNNPQGWFLPNAEKVLSSFLGPDTKVVVELGSWLGKSTRFILNAAPNALVVAVDHWKGSPEHKGRFDDMLKHLYETFLVNCWDYRDRLVPLRMDTIRGLTEVHNFGLKPDLIYVDAGHDFSSVVADIEKACSLFPNAQIVGDDWLWGKGKPVQHAVKACGTKLGREIGTVRNTWFFR